MATPTATPTATLTYESTLFQSRQVYVYQLPKRTSVGGYRAKDWADERGDLVSTAVWKGRLKVVESEWELPPTGDASAPPARESRCDLRLEDASTGETFGKCPYDVSGHSVEAVLDSSRYFVILLVDAESTPPRKQYAGIGFEDRSESFDFNVALQDWVKRQRSAAGAGKAQGGGGAAGGQADAAGPSPHIPRDGPRDLSLKEGQTFSIKLPGAGGRKIRDSSKPATTTTPAGGLGGGGGGGFLPPPPSRRG